MALGVLAIAIAAAALLWSGADTSNVGKLGFERPLTIPPLLEPTEDGKGRKVFELDMREGTSELLAGKRTATWGFNGSYLGPTLRASRGDRVEMRVRNRLPETSTVHWHGMHLPAAADGGPYQTIEPGKTWKPSWRIDQPAASLWYHPHPHGDTEEHVYRGLAGMFILDDPASEALDLPRRYGVDDIPLIVQDKRFEDSGELSFSQGAISPIGQLGDEILVNGTADPHLTVSTTRVRLRLLNASTGRSYDFGFADGRRFDTIATDGGLLNAPERLDRVQLSPGERAEKELAESAPVPAQLARNEAAEVSGSERVRRFELGSRDINDLQMDMDRIDQTVPVDTTEIWEIENRAGIPHNFHIHDTRFEILELAGEPPGPALSGLKDTVAVPPGETVRVATRFSDYTDPSTPYMFHCHLLQHEDRGMMGQFVVVDRDEATGASAVPRGENDHGGPGPGH